VQLVRRDRKSDQEATGQCEGQNRMAEHAVDDRSPDPPLSVLRAESAEMTGRLFSIPAAASFTQSGPSPNPFSRADGCADNSSFQNTPRKRWS